MFTKPVTLIVVTRDRLIRADFASARASEPTSLTVAERPHLDDPVALVETAVGLEKRKPGRVLVLSSDFFTHSVALASANTRDLSAEDLQQMLNFEAETISNISAFEATSAALGLGEAAGQRHYWLTQIPTTVRDQIDDAVRKLGGKLIGIAHPGGVPFGFDERPDVGLPGRVEFWPNAAVRIVAVDGAITKAHVDDGAVVAGWVEATADWKKQGGATHVVAVVPEGLVRDAADVEPGTSFITLEDDATLRRWLGAWRRVIGAKAAAPVILPAVRRLTQRERNMISLVLGLVVFAACYAHHRWVSSNIDAIGAERKVLEASGIDLNAAKTQLAAVEKDLKKAGDEKTALAEKVVQAETMFDVHRRRLAELMRRLADDSSHEWVIQKIIGTGREIKLHGLTMHPEHISELTAAITRDFGKLGWGVDPARQEARNVGDDGGPWGFEILLRDLKPPSPKPGADPSSTSTPPSTIVRVPAP